MYLAIRLGLAKGAGWMLEQWTTLDSVSASFTVTKMVEKVLALDYTERDKVPHAGSCRNRSMA